MWQCLWARLAVPRNTVLHHDRAATTRFEICVRPSNHIAQKRAARGHRRDVRVPCAIVMRDLGASIIDVSLVRFWYKGVRSNDTGETDPGMCAKKTSQLIFEWTIRRADREETCTVTIRCDHAKDRGVPAPRPAYCSAAGLEQLGNEAASKHQTALLEKQPRADVHVQCRSGASTYVIVAHVLLVGSPQ